MVDGIDQPAIVAERFQDCCRLRRRLGGQFTDRVLGPGEFVIEKFGQRVVERIGASSARRK